MLFHTPVLLKEVCEYLPGDTRLIIDCTLGHGGHAIALLSLAEKAKLIGLDVDENMLTKARLQLMNKIEECCIRYGEQKLRNVEEMVEFVHGNYSEIKNILQGKKADFILNDLGVNIDHFKVVERGFSIRGTAYLDMRFDTSNGITAADILATYTVGQLKTLFESYADFSSSKAFELAHRIVTTRKQHPITTTQAFKKILNDCGLGDPASIVIFQALRIETNNELGNLKKFLVDFPECLQLSGRCVIITYHSIEDRLVKQTFQALANTGKYRLVTKKPIKPTYQEISINRASRSAKMRILEKISE